MKLKLEPYLVYKCRESVRSTEQEESGGEEDEILVFLVSSMTSDDSSHLENLSQLVHVLSLPVPDGASENLQFQLLLSPCPSRLTGRLFVETDAPLSVSPVHMVILQVLLDLLYGPSEPL